MKTRYPISRVVGSVIGLYALFIFVELIQNYLEGPPASGWVVSVFHFSWLDEDPTNSALTSGACLLLFILGAGHSWIKPRQGSFLMGMGWLSWFLMSFMSSVPHSKWDPYYVEWAPSFLLLLIPAIWYLKVCVKDETEHLTKKESR